MLDSNTNSQQRQKTSDSDIIDQLTIVEDTNFKENVDEYQQKLKLRNVELQQLRKNSTKSPTTLNGTQKLTNTSQQLFPKRGSLVDMHTNLQCTQTYLGQIQQKKRKEPISIKTNELASLKRYDSLESMFQQTSNRNYLKTSNDYCSRNQNNLYFHAQQIQVQQLIKTLGKKY